MRSSGLGGRGSNECQEVSLICFVGGVANAPFTPKPLIAGVRRSETQEKEEEEINLDRGMHVLISLCR